MVVVFCILLGLAAPSGVRGTSLNLPLQIIFLSPSSTPVFTNLCPCRIIFCQVSESRRLNDVFANFSSSAYPYATFISLSQQIGVLVSLSYVFKSVSEKLCPSHLTLPIL